MSKKLFYFIALLTLPLIRVLVLNTGYDQWLEHAHYEHAAAGVRMLRDNALFQQFIGGWVFPFYVIAVIAFWCTEEDDSRIGQQFLLLPLGYIPFTILGFTLVNADFQVSYLYVHPIVIITFGYLYVLTWVFILWLLSKIGLFK